MKYLILSLAFMLTIMNSTTAQKSQAEVEYQKRITQERINGVYIPADLAECFAELNKKISKEAKAKFIAVDEATASKNLHYSLGRWIWYNWSLYEGSRLSIYMNKVGVNHPEDMAQVILITYHRYLKKEPLEVKALADMIREARDKERERLKQN
jgi:DNA-binding transcriptional regulator YhcF (GntR family)